jgi:hypothetical protein
MISTDPVAIPAFDLTVNLWVGHSPNTPATAGLRFSSNVGPDYTQVATTKTLRFPAEPWRQDNQYGNTYRIPFDVPFRFLPGRTGILDVEVLRTTYCATGPGDPVFAFYNDSSKPKPGEPMYPSFYGQPCGPGGGLGNDNFLMTSIVSAGNPGFAVMFPEWASGRIRSAAFYAGVSDSTYGGISLPFALDALGAPGCSIYASLDVSLPMISNGAAASGTEFAELSPPNDPRLVGSLLYIQAFRLDATANRLGLHSSNGVRVGIAAHVDPVSTMLTGPEFSLMFGADGAQRKVGLAPRFTLDSR